jgi:siroheme synthase-like protein
VSDIEIDAFPVALSLQGRAVLLIGGGDESVQKLPKLLAAGARVTIVAPRVEPALARAAIERKVVWFARAFVPSDCAGVHVVLLTEIDPELAAQLCALKPRGRFWLCALDQPAFSDFYLVSTLKRGPIQIAISTSGRAPLLARRIRQALELGLGDAFGEFARNFAALRARVRTLPKAARTEVLERALAGFAMEVRLRYPERNGQSAGYPPDPARDE